MSNPSLTAGSSQSEPALQNVLVATDFGAPAEAAFRYARNLAGAFGARLHLLHVAEDLRSLATVDPSAGVSLEGQQKEMEIEALDRLRDMLDDQLRSSAAQTVVMTSHHPAAAIVRYATEAEIDLLVLATHGRSGFTEFFMGSVAQEVVRRAPCPVLTLRAGEAVDERVDATVARAEQ